MTERRTLGDHARFGTLLQNYAKDLLHAVREKASQIMEERGTDNMTDEGVRFQKHQRPGDRKAMVHIHVREDR